MRESGGGSGHLTSVVQGLILILVPAYTHSHENKVWELGDAWVVMNAALYIKAKISWVYPCMIRIPARVLAGYAVSVTWLGHT